MKLQSLAGVRSGLVLSRKQSKEPTDYRYPLINLRCIQQEGNIDLHKADIYEAKESLKEEHLVVIRIEDKRLLPEYLFWLLNTQKVRHKIYENTTSNMLGAIKAKFLMDFELVLLPIEVQQKIAQLNLLAKKESQLLKELAAEKEKLYSSLLDQEYKREKRGK